MTQINNEVSSVVICQHCKGSGTIRIKTIECQHCKGSGCLTEVVKTTYTAYKRNRD